jgi:hypothetical protein
VGLGAGALSPVGSQGSEAGSVGSGGRGGDVLSEIEGYVDVQA